MSGAVGGYPLTAINIFRILRFPVNCFDTFDVPVPVLFSSLLLLFCSGSILIFKIGPIDYRLRSRHFTAYFSFYFSRLQLMLEVKLILDSRTCFTYVLFYKLWFWEILFSISLRLFFGLGIILEDSSSSSWSSKSTLLALKIGLLF